MNPLSFRWLLVAGVLAASAFAADRRQPEEYINVVQHLPWNDASGYYDHGLMLAPDDFDWAGLSWSKNAVNVSIDGATLKKTKARLRQLAAEQKWPATQDQNTPLLHWRISFDCDADATKPADYFILTKVQAEKALGEIYLMQVRAKQRPLIQEFMKRYEFPVPAKPAPKP